MLPSRPGPRPALSLWLGRCRRGEVEKKPTAGHTGARRLKTLGHPRDSDIRWWCNIAMAINSWFLRSTNAHNHLNDIIDKQAGNGSYVWGLIYEFASSTCSSVSTSLMTLKNTAAAHPIQARQDIGRTNRNKQQDSSKSRLERACIFC